MLYCEISYYVSGCIEKGVYIYVVAESNIVYIIDANPSVGIYTRMDRGEGVDLITKTS